MRGSVVEQLFKALSISWGELEEALKEFAVLERLARSASVEDVDVEKISKEVETSALRRVSPRP
ncbi:MAG: hypothetical protein GXO00_01940 [Candidatus Diapherotrites archaeon]|nr:hypothetical protein [Candidatus Diapherotrites archaeon]